MNLFNKIKSSFKHTVDVIKEKVTKATENLHDLFLPEEKVKKDFGKEVKEQYKEVEIKFGKKTAKILHSRGLAQNTAPDDLSPKKVKELTKDIKDKPLIDFARAETKVYSKQFLDSYFLELKGSKRYDERINNIVSKLDGNLSTAYKMVDMLEEKSGYYEEGEDVKEDPEAFRDVMISRLEELETWLNKNVR